MAKQHIFLVFIFCFSYLFSKAQDTTIYIQAVEIVDSGLKFDATKLNQYDGLGNKDGFWKEYYTHMDKKLRYEGQFIHGIAVGLFTFYYDNGVKEATMNYFNNGKNASTHLYHPNGTILAMGLYEDKKKDSLWRYYHVSGYLIAEDFYRDAQKNGPAKVFFEDGKPLEESNWVNGKQDGIWKQYYTNGKPKFVMHYKDGLRQGEVQFFYDSGSLKGSGVYKDSHRDSVWIYYKPDGSLLKQIIYKDQKVISTFEPDNVKKAREKEDRMMGDKKIESIEELDDKQSPFIEKY